MWRGTQDRFSAGPGDVALSTRYHQTHSLPKIISYGDLSAIISTFTRKVLAFKWVVERERPITSSAKRSGEGEKNIPPLCNSLYDFLHTVESCFAAAQKYLIKGEPQNCNAYY